MGEAGLENHWHRDQCPRTGTEVFLPPPPVITPYLESVDMQLPFPPRWGEHNEEVYGALGYDAQKLTELKEEGVV